MKERTSLSALEIILHSPGQLSVIDEDGRKTNQNSANIPASIFIKTAEQKVIISQPVGKYVIEVLGIASGTYTLEVKGYLNGKQFYSNYVTNNVISGQKDIREVTVSKLFGPVTIIDNLNKPPIIITPYPTLTITPTIKFSPTFTITPTLTPVPAVLALEFKAGDIYRYSASPHPQFRIKNKGTGAIDVSKLEIRYWYKYDGIVKPEESYVDWAGINGNPITDKVNIGIIKGTFGTQDRYLKITFKSNVGNLGNGINDYLEVNTRFNKQDWGKYDQANDWSFIAYTSFKIWNKVTVYYDGTKIYGYEPGEVNISINKTPFTPSEISESNVYNYPNPCNGITTIRFSLSQPADVSIMIYDVNGKLIWKKQMSTNETIAGINTVRWDGVNDFDMEVSNGVYVLKIVSENKIITKKIVVIK